MARYAVTKYFGHFAQCWELEANSESDAWDRAERDGKRTLQSVYKKEVDTYSFGYVVNIDEKLAQESISNEQYWDWMADAINKGMIVTPCEYEKATGLPFHDI